MRIDSSMVALRSESRRTQQFERKESLHYWVQERPEGGKKDGVAAALEELKVGRARSREMWERLKDEEEYLLMIRLLLARLTGDHAELRKIMRSLKGTGRLRFGNGPGGGTSVTHTHGGVTRGEMTYTIEETYRESQRTTLNAEGMVKTADGREIAFDLELYLNREFSNTSRIELTRHGITGNDTQHASRQTARPVDPLVINFGGNAADLKNVTFSFDLDADGNAENIAQLGSSSGFLALDKNGDGIINDGSELFGPGTGNGFTELAVLDSDGNQWLDENDAVYNDLGVWRKTGETDTILTLKEADVGAIFLGSVNAPFTYKDGENVSQAFQSRAGLYLKESGTPGSIQQIDYFV